MTIQTSDPIPSREMTLDEWCERLPESHSARVELRELRATVSRLRCDAQGFHDAAITAGMEIADWRRRLKDCDDRNEYLNTLVNDLRIERDALAQDAAKMREALLPFAHPDLSKQVSGNIEGDSSPVFGRDKALLTLGDFRRAADAALSTTTEASK